MFYFRDSPGGADTAPPRVEMGGDLNVDGLVRSRSQGYAFPDGSIQTTTASVSSASWADPPASRSTPP